MYVDRDLYRSLLAYVTSVAVELNKIDKHNDWAVKPCDGEHYINMRSQTGLRLHIEPTQQGREPIKLYYSGNNSDLYDYRRYDDAKNGFDPKAGISVSQSPARAAKALLTRLIPVVTAYRVELLKRKQADEDYETLKNKIMRRLAAAAQCSAPEMGAETFEFGGSYATQYHPQRATVKPYVWTRDGVTTATADIKLDNLSLELAEQVLKLVSRGIK